MVGRRETGAAMVATVIATGIVLGVLLCVAFETRVHLHAMGASLDCQRALAAASARLEDLTASPAALTPGSHEFETVLEGFHGTETIREVEPGLLEVEVRVAERRERTVVALRTLVAREAR